MKRDKFRLFILWLLLGWRIIWYAKPYIQDYAFQHNFATKVNTEDEKKYVGSIREIYTLLEEWYFDKEKLSLSGMWEWGVKWFVSALDDPYTEYFTTDENADFTTSLKWEEDFEWIGAGVAKKEWGIEIQEVYKWTPAAMVGLQPLDMILAISGTKTDTLTLQEAVDMIRGPKGTQVKLLIYRAARKDDGKNGIFTVEPTRQKVEIPSVLSESIALPNKKGTACYISISVIGDTTDSTLQKELLACQKQNPRGYILDLRGNGWWYLQKWVDIASHFLPKEKVIVSTKYTTYPSEIFTTAFDGTYINKPIVVLVDALTASAGEIIAGALQQNAQAKVVGTTTFGKWSIQTVVDIGSGAWLKYTIGKWYLPDDTNIDKIGLKPDVEVEFDTAAYQKNMYDNQKQKAISVLGEIIQ